MRRIQRKDNVCTVCSVCPCLSETVCSYLLYGHMLLHCSDMLSCPNFQLKTASSSSYGGSPTSFLTRNTCFNVSLELQGDCSDQLTLICIVMVEMIHSGYTMGQWRMVTSLALLSLVQCTLFSLKQNTHQNHYWSGHCTSIGWIPHPVCIYVLILATSPRAMQSSFPSFLLVSLETHLQYWMCLDYNIGYVTKLYILQYTYIQYIHTYIHTYVHTYVRTYRQYIHVVFHSFPPTSPSRVTTWWGDTSCSE